MKKRSGSSKLERLERSLLLTKLRLLSLLLSKIDTTKPLENDLAECAAKRLADVT